MPTYREGKQTDTITLEYFSACLDKSFSLRDKSFVALLYWTGVRKSEALERVREDFTVRNKDLVIDFGQRKKHGLKVPPLEIPLDLPFVDLITERVNITRTFLRVWPFTGVTAWRIVKKILGKKYYPHFLRLNRITRMADDPASTYPELKSWTGIKSSRSLDVYIGFSKKRMQAGKARLRKELQK